jgi:hypothetical protein
MDGNFVNFIMQEVLQDVRRASAQLVRDGLLAPDIEQRFLDAHGCRIDVPHDPAEKWVQYLCLSGAGFLDGLPNEKQTQPIRYLAVWTDSRNGIYGIVPGGCEPCGTIRLYSKPFAFQSFVLRT